MSLNGEISARKKLRDEQKFAKKTNSRATEADQV